MVDELLEITGKNLFKRIFFLFLDQIFRLYFWRVVPFHKHLAVEKVFLIRKNLSCFFINLIKEQLGLLLFLLFHCDDNALI